MEMKQLSFDDFEHIELPAVNFQVSDLALNIYNYLFVYHKGKDNAISGPDLARRFNLDDRSLREHFDELKPHGVVESSAVGYWAYNFGDERDKTNLRRVLNSLPKVIHEETDLLLFYKELNIIKERLGLS